MIVPKIEFIALDAEVNSRIFRVGAFDTFDKQVEALKYLESNELSCTLNLEIPFVGLSLKKTPHVRLPHVKTKFYCHGMRF